MPGRILVDSNVLLDILAEDPVWFSWSADHLAELAEKSVLVINPVIYAEVSIGFATIEEIEGVFPSPYFVREEIPWEAAFLAGKCFLSYRRSGGAKRSPLPDFFIGAHAAVRGMTLLTRDAQRYRTYFPRLQLIAPE
jgi:predicted nucleic acid-binding protein